MAEPRPILAYVRLTKLIVAYAWSAAIAVAGLWLWREPEALVGLAQLVIGLDAHTSVQVARRLALAALAGGTLSYMLFVADDLCPDAPMEVTGFLKGFAVTMLCGALGWALFLILNQSGSLPG